MSTAPDEPGSDDPPGEVADAALSAVGTASAGATTTTEVRFTAVGEVSVADVEEELDPIGTQVVIAPEAVGICGSDLSVLAGHHPFIKPPLVPGHEVVGRVQALGPDAYGLSVGQRVLLDPLVVPSGSSHTGAVNTDESATVIGFRIPGAARTRFLVDAAQLHGVPDTLPGRIAVLCEPLATGVHAARRSTTGAGDRLEDVLVIGGGSIGLCVLLALKSIGACCVTVVDPVAAKRELASRLGADATLTAEDELPRGRFSAVLDCVVVPQTLASALGATAGGGAVVMVGIPAAQTWGLTLARAQRFEVDLLGSGMYTPEDVERAIALVADAVVDPGPLVTATYPLADAEKAYRAAQQPDSVKVLLDLEG